MNAIVGDLRYAARVLWKHRGFSLLAILALGIGIGANASIYSLADVLLYRPLQLPDLDRAVQLCGTERGTDVAMLEIAPADFLDFERDAKSLDHLSAFAFGMYALTGDGHPESVIGYRVSPGLFSALAAQPALGRGFLPDEGQSEGSDRVVVLGHPLWTSRFGSNPNVLGRTILLEGAAYQVIGVMPREFRFPAPAQLWLPLRFTAKELENRRSFFLGSVGRLKPGVNLQQANAEIAALGGRLASQYPDSHGKRGARLALVRETVSGELTAGFTRMLLGAVLFLLLIACTNVANLQFARVSMRTRELAVRTALGAKRWHIIRQLLVENVLLACLGALVGIVIAIWGLDALRLGLPAEVMRYLPSWERLGLNMPVLAWTLAATVASGVISGILPAWLGSKTDVLPALKESGRASTGRSRHRLRSVLVVSQIALALVLLIGAALFARGLRNVSEPGPNMQPSQVLTFNVSLPESRYREASQVREFHRELTGKLANLPGVTSASMVTNLPYSGASNSTRFTIEGRPPQPGGERLTAHIQGIDAGYFRAAHIPLVRGREFTMHDGDAAQRVAIVSEDFARLYFNDRDPIGAHFRLGDEKSSEPWITIAGVVKNIRHNPFYDQPRETVYFPYAQGTVRSASYLLRTTGDPLRSVADVRAQVASIDPDQPISEVGTWAKAIRDQLLGYSYVATLMGIFGIVALLLSAIGVYGVMAYSVSERSHEIGLRMALGADSGSVLWMVGRWGMGLALLGVGIGLPAAFGVSTLLSGLVFGVSAFDAVTFMTGVGVLSAAALLACYVPVRRAVSLDPMVTLRNE